MKRTNAQEKPATPKTVWVTVEMGDFPHIIERYTDLFNSHQMTLAELASKAQSVSPQSPPRLILSMIAHGRSGVRLC
ncbi:MAG: Glycine cleavage system transcriptional repressor [Sodalis sp.]|nr:MAG: Glycine cleavage system transcriptional repressor [Sodalis sp.]